MSGKKVTDAEIDELVAEANARRSRPGGDTGRPLADLEQLRSYLASRGIATTEIERGLRSADPAIDIQWASEHRQIRFRSQLALDVADHRRSAVAAIVARANANAGRAVWRAEPDVHAEIVAPTAGDGSVWTRDVDDAIAALREALSRDAAALRAAAGG